MDSSPSTHSVTRGDHSKVIAMVIPMPPPPPPPPMSIPIAEVPRPSDCCNNFGRGGSGRSAGAMGAARAGGGARGAGAPAGSGGGGGAWLVVNETGGGGRARRRWKRAVPGARAALEARFGSVREQLTLGPGHARELAQRAAEEGADVVIAVGGDGTVGEVVCGLMAAAPVSAGPAARPALGIIPLGSGNDFARGLGWSTSVGKAVERIATGELHPVDVGRVYLGTLEQRDGEAAPEFRYFLNEVSMGLPATVGALVPRYKWLGATPGYKVATVRAIITHRRCPVSVRADGGEAYTVEEPTIMTVANGQYFGSGMRVAPGASPDSGALEMVAIKGIGLGGFIRYGHLLNSGGHVEKSFTDVAAVREVELIPLDGPEGSYLLEADGDLIGSLPCTVSVLPGAVRLAGWQQKQ